MWNHRRLLELATENQLKIDRFALCYLTANDSDRWKSFVGIVGPALNLPPMADVEETRFFGGFERFVS